ncbi:MAG: TIM barrel protein, partial [Planctomycetaceae bacterium]|nr:TIM barrel protein [Planctomycetaceae bacterium]
RFAPETGLFEATAGCDVGLQIALAADWGFPAFSDAGLLQRTSTEAEAIVAALAAADLTLSPPRGPAIPFATCELGRWQTEASQALLTLTPWRAIGLRLDYGPATHQGIAGSGVFSRAMRAALRNLADIAQGQGMVLILEPWDDGRCGADLFAAAHQLVRACEHPALKLCVDTYRWSAAGMDVAAVFENASAWIGHVELADFPGGCEAGTGRLPLATCLRRLWTSGYLGVIGLRHGTSQWGAAGDQLVRRACARLMSDVAAPSLA